MQMPPATHRSTATRMRILLVNYEYPPLGGGGGVASREVAVELGKRHEVDVLTSAGCGLPAQERQDGVTIHRVPVVGRRQFVTRSHGFTITVRRVVRPAAAASAVSWTRLY